MLESDVVKAGRATLLYSNFEKALGTNDILPGN